jgi:hypothetical protein
MKKLSFIFIVLFFIVFGQFTGSNSAFGLSLMGPPRSILQEGQNSFSLELQYNEMDLQTFGDVTESYISISNPTTSYTEYKLDKIKTTMPSVRIDTSLFENWDVFLRVGAADASDEINEEMPDGSLGHQYQDFDGKFGFSYGIGTRTTFFSENNTSWGGIFEINWINPGSSEITDKSDTNFTGEAEIDYWEFQLAIGPTIELNSVRIYGGPFMDFINGDLDMTGTTLDTEAPFLPMEVKSSQEIREKSQFGGYLGAQWRLGENNTLVTEAQITGDAWGIGIGTTWKF